MSESYQTRCTECGDQGVIKEPPPSGWKCSRHRAPESPAEMIARMAREAAATIPEGDAEAQRRAALVAEYKNRVWLDRVLAVTRSSAAHTAFAPRQATTALRGVQKWLADGCSHSLMLRGGVGAGKTTAACFAVRHWLEPRVEWSSNLGEPIDFSAQHAPTVTWLHPDELVSAVLHDYDERSPRLHRYVVIDDLGTETRADFISALNKLFDREGHVILFTSNVPRADMLKRYSKDQRLISRFKHFVRAVDCPEESLRRDLGGF